ncbi:hypothetical protein C8A03DRAFT_46988 [Achaetomium macrosporum]|uniref:C3H1-type domain-containing protein n=1 Tax=Achaetomium macrosporum TaxID=79813 RepID=A0AAN7C3U9_9PEZI|nr:hypothetical protein C8A03DRAFT_46988 [Achaetomium macrosporum]
MLSDQEIEQAAAQLAKYKEDNELSRLLDQHAVLIEEYKRLKSDYEEGRETRERYKQMAKVQEHNPFVLVLVDGYDYVFNESLLAKRADGGTAASQMLNNVVKTSLRRKGLEHCQVMVRIYANVLALSRLLSKLGLISGGETSALGSFIASFNRAYGLTDFVDVGRQNENIVFKLRALLRLHAENTQCKHIYFAACHDVSYITELTPFMGNSSKFTLVKLPVSEFHGVFRHTPLDDAPVYRPPSNDSADLRSPSSPPIPGNDTTSTVPSLARQQDLFAKLPRKNQIPEGYVTVNQNNHRLDPYLLPVDAGAMKRLKALIRRRKICFAHHLRRSCAGHRCENDHEPLEPELLPALEALARAKPCPRRGACKYQGCYHGHICQDPDCKDRGGKTHCKITHAAHTEDWEVIYLFAAAEEGRHAEPAKSLKAKKKRRKHKLVAPKKSDPGNKDTGDNGSRGSSSISG